MTVQSSAAEIQNIGPSVDPLDAYRRMFANAEDGMSAWWYLGTTFVDIESFPSVPVNQVETLMIYKSSTLSNDAFRMDWWEIGYMRDAVTGEIASTWINPITGKTVAAPNQFEEGPAHFIVRRTDDGVEVDLVQAHARIESVTVDFREYDGRLFMQQTERKVRGFPLPDGSMPSLDSKNVSKAVTRLSMFSNLDDLKQPDAPCSGSYDFELSAPAWMGFGDRRGSMIVRGIMIKAGMDEKLNPTAWKRLQQLFPDCFDGERVRPRWQV